MGAMGAKKRRKKRADRLVDEGGSTSISGTETEGKNDQTRLGGLIWAGEWGQTLKRKSSALACDKKKKKNNKWEMNLSPAKDVRSLDLNQKKKNFLSMSI